MSAIAQRVATQQVDTDTCPSVRIILAGVDRLVPSGASDELAQAWLAAPMAGMPLYARLLEPLMGLDIPFLGIAGGRCAELLLEHLSENQVFGFEPQAISMHELTTDVLNHTLILPACGLIQQPVADLLRGRSNITTTMSFPMGPFGNAILIPPGQNPTAALDAPMQFALHQAECVRVDSAPRLIDAARAALRRDEARLEATGSWQGGVLCGTGAMLSPLAECDMSHALGAESAVGKGTLIEGGVRFGPGAVIGERSFVGRGAAISDAVILDDTFVRPSEQVHGVVRWRDQVIR